MNTWMKMDVKLLVFLFLVCVIAVFLMIPPPETAEAFSNDELQCMLDRIDQVHTDAAAGMLRVACQQLY